MQTCEPAFARKLVEGAVEYAESIGLPPSSEYRIAKLIFSDVDPSTCREKFTYGKDGKPLFISGPYDTPARCRVIVDTLTQQLGPGGFHFMMGIDPSAVSIHDRMRRIDPASGTSYDEDQADFEDDDA